MRARLALLAALAAAVLGTAGAANDPALRLPDPAQEARARHLFQQLRCVVCQNESVDASEADIAGDIRKIVRAQVAAGRTDDQVRAYLVQKYGEFILLTPPLNPGNIALWLTPFAVVLLGGGYLWIKSRRPAVEARGQEPDELSEEELRALESIGAGDIDVGDRDLVSPHSGVANVHGAVAIKH